MALMGTSMFVVGVLCGVFFLRASQLLVKEIKKSL